MAGTTAVEVPVTLNSTTIVNESPRMEGHRSPEKSPLKMDSGEVKTSPQGKGVGIFGLEGSPTVITQVDGPAKDPKVSIIYAVLEMRGSLCNGQPSSHRNTMDTKCDVPSEGSSSGQIADVCQGHISECPVITYTHSFELIAAF